MRIADSSETNTTFLSNMDINSLLSFDDTDLRVVPTPVGKRRFLLQYKDDNTFVFQIDNSSLEVFATCPRSAEYKLVAGRSPLPSAALTAGSAVHEGLESWYKDITNGVDRDTAKQNALAASQIPFDLRPNMDMREWRTPERVVTTLLSYFNKYEKEPFSIMSIEGKPQVEIPFSLPLTVIDMGGVELQHHTFGDLVEPDTWPEGATESTPVILNEVHVYWTGKMDLLIMLDGALMVSDHKTSSMMGPTFWADFELSNQTIGYSWAASEISGQDVKGLLVNCIYWRPPTKTEVKTEFHRQRFYYSQAQKDEWVQDTIANVSDFLTSLAREYFPKNPKWCMGKFGACRYHMTCVGEPETRQDMLFSHAYVDTTWNPLEKHS